MILCTDTILPAGRKCRHAPGDFAEGKIHVPLSGSSDEEHLAVRQISSEAASGRNPTHISFGRLGSCYGAISQDCLRKAFGKQGFPGKALLGLAFSPFNIKTNSIKKVL